MTAQAEIARVLPLDGQAHGPEGLTEDQTKAWRSEARRVGREHGWSIRTAVSFGRPLAVVNEDSEGHPWYVSPEEVRRRMDEYWDRVLGPLNDDELDDD